jgi:hypothetical protein
MSVVDDFNRDKKNMSLEDRHSELAGFVEVQWREHSNKLVDLEGRVRNLGDTRDFTVLQAEVDSLASQFKSLRRELFAALQEEISKLHAAETHSVQVAIDAAVAREIANEIGKTIVVTRQANTSEIHNGAPAVVKK